MIGPVECAECGWSDDGHLQITDEGREHWLCGYEGRWVLECGHCGEWLDKDNVNRRGSSSMDEVWEVWENVLGRWHRRNTRCDLALALTFAEARRSVFYRRVCVCPAGVSLDVAYPEAAR